MEATFQPVQFINRPAKSSSFKTGMAKITKWALVVISMLGDNLRLILDQGREIMLSSNVECFFEVVIRQRISFNIDPVLDLGIQFQNWEASFKTGNNLKGSLKTEHINWHNAHLGIFVSPVSKLNDFCRFSFKTGLMPLWSPKFTERNTEHSVREPEFGHKQHERKHVGVLHIFLRVYNNGLKLYVAWIIITKIGLLLFNDTACCTLYVEVYFHNWIILHTIGINQNYIQWGCGKLANNIVMGEIHHGMS